MKFARLLRPLLVAGLVLASAPALAQSGNIDDTRGGTDIFADDPLIVAVYENRVERVHALIVRQHPLSRTDGDGRTALIWGAIQGSYDSLKLMLEAEARPDIVDKVGNSALYHAAENGHPEVVDLLLSHDAPVDQENRDGRTPLMAAVRNGHAQIVQALITAGADIGHTDFTGRTALDIARAGRSRQVTKLLEAAGAR